MMGVEFTSVYMYKWFKLPVTNHIVVLNLAIIYCIVSGKCSFPIFVIIQVPLCNQPSCKFLLGASNFIIHICCWACVHSSNHCDDLQVPLHPAARYAHTSHSFVRSILRLQYKLHVLQATNTAKTWLVCFLAQYSFLHCYTNLIWIKVKHKQSNNVGQFGSPCQLTLDLGWTLARG